MSSLSLTDTKSLHFNDSLNNYHIIIISKKCEKKIILATLVFVLMILIIGSLLLSTQVDYNEDMTTQKITTTTLYNNITMTVYDFTSTPNSFTCEKKWMGDGICDDETNLLKCDFDYGDCCVNEIVDTNCHKCICHTDGKKHQMTTTTIPPFICFLEQQLGNKDFC